LMRSPNTVTPNCVGCPIPVQPMSFQGSFTATQAGYIGNVALNVYQCQISTLTNLNTGTYIPLVPITISPADCMAGTQTFQQVLNPLTATDLSAPVQVAAAGETVTVSVVLSFQ
jgi:hypothetical protein